MASGLLFVTQALLDSWAGQGKIDFVGNVMTLQQGEGKGRSYALEPAVRFLKVIGAEGDPHKLLAKVKQVTQLREMGAEHLENSVIVGDVAYEVEPGFLAEAAALQAAYAARPPEPPGAQAGTPASSRPAPSAPEATPPLPIPAPPAQPPPAPTAGVPAPPRGRPVSRPAPLPRELEEKRKEAEALARFLLDNLS